MARRYNRLKQRKPLIVICSEGGKKSSEYYYFSNFSNRNLRIRFSTGNSTDPTGMLDDLITFIKNEDVKSEDNVRIFLVLDTDLDNKRTSEIKEIEQKCRDNNIEIITSAPTFEIWYLMHFRKSNLKFSTSNSVKKELEKANGTYSETMDMYSNIKNKTNFAVENAKFYEQQAIKNNEELLCYNPHTAIYKILDAIDEFNKFND